MTASQPRTAFTTAAGTRTSSLTISQLTPHSRSLRPRDISSKTRTSWPSAANRLTSAEPMNPVPPVTRYLMKSALAISQSRTARSGTALAIRKAAVFECRPGTILASDARDQHLPAHRLPVTTAAQHPADTLSRRKEQPATTRRQGPETRTRNKQQDHPADQAHESTIAAVTRTCQENRQYTKESTSPIHSSHTHTGHTATHTRRNSKEIPRLFGHDRHWVCQ